MVEVEGHVTSPYSEQRDGDNHPAHRGAAAAWSSEPAVHARREGHHMYPISDALHEERSELSLGHGEATHLAKCEEKRRDTVWLAEMFRVLRLSQRLYKRSHADGSESASPTSIQGVRQRTQFDGDELYLEDHSDKAGATGCKSAEYLVNAQI